MRFPPDIFNRYGTNMLLKSGENAKTIKAFFQPLRKKQQNYFIPQRHLSGVFTKDKHLIIAPADTKIKRGDILVVNDREYAVVSSGNYIFQDCLLYVWAVVSAHTEQIEDDFDD